MVFRFSKKFIFLLFIILVLTSSLKIHANDITRSLIKNNSIKPWTAKFIFEHGTLDSISECSANQECMVEANSFKIIVYETEHASDGLKGMVIISDSNNKRIVFNIDKDNKTTPNLPWLTVLDDSNCPKAVSINKTYGDDGRMTAQGVGFILKGFRNDAGGGIEINQNFCI